MTPVLVDGVPDWLEPSLYQWVADRCEVGGDGLARRIELRLRTRLPGGRHNYNLHPILLFWQTAGDAERIRLIGAILAEWERLHESARQDYRGHLAVGEAERAVASLAAMLTDGGSLWRFEQSPHWSLVRRVEEAAEHHYVAAAGVRSDAADQLRRAWAACYGQHPNYDEAYRCAVLAVESVVLPETIPNDKSGTLGKAIRNIKDTRVRWSVGAVGANEPTGSDALIEMLDLLWKNQQRHAGSDGAIVDVGGPEAEVAVTLAVTILHWFRAGLVSRV